MADLSEKVRRPLIFGIINVTPDSFSDGGDFFSIKESSAYTQRLLEDGADFLDIGAESTKPGATAISSQEEWSRLEPVLNILDKKNLLKKISIDTRNPETMLKVSKLGVSWINCVGSTPDDEVLSSLIKENSELGFVATHIHGNPQSMQLQPLGVSKVLNRVNEFFESSYQQLVASKFDVSKILLDPGIGFGKTDGANLLLLRECHQWSKKLKIAIGVSRKSIFGRALDISSPKERDQVSKVAEIALWLSNVSMIRTHNVLGLTKAFTHFHEVYS